MRTAYKTYGGKTVEQALPFFISSPIQRSSELLFAPAKVFNYYVSCFVAYLSSEESREDADAASTFLGLLQNRLNKPGASEVASAVLQIKSEIDKIARRQGFYDAAVDVYGSFPKIKQEIDAVLSGYVKEYR